MLSQDQDTSNYTKKNLIFFIHSYFFVFMSARILIHIMYTYAYTYKFVYVMRAARVCVCIHYILSDPLIYAN